MILMTALLQQKKSLVLILENQKQTYNNDNIYLLVNEKEIYKFKDENNNVIFPVQLFLENIYNEFDDAESGEVFLRENVHDFSFNCNAFYNSEVLTLTSI